ncbi:Serine/arginine repetitive matrix protein 1 [Tetrabaena socialis]|uniref:Serine/arginine repetitive matrix protein 1 n=1 Tax=Tetrabaena socialis TaxID=47790 RepID=A0A2J7ZWD2_9CHLO|nr:Serine/arginine repetitive matrix protein 1 [Tetrabaena socialis]|eukprot:PNH04601.1 Serine/arginine repetitive matrix protein 1 [Tetrabaena socialis]
MSGLGGFRGVSAGQDARFSDKAKKNLKDLIKAGKVPKELELKVDLKKVNWPVMHEWICKRVTQLLGGLEEEVLIQMIYNFLEDQEPRLVSRCATVKDPGSNMLPPGAPQDCRDRVGGREAPQPAPREAGLQASPSRSPRKADKEEAPSPVRDTEPAEARVDKDDAQPAADGHTPGAKDGTERGHKSKGKDKKKHKKEHKEHKEHKKKHKKERREGEGGGGGRGSEDEEEGGKGGAGGGGAGGSDREGGDVSDPELAELRAKALQSAKTL